MCNLYNVGPSPNEERAAWEKQVAEAVTRLPKAVGIRKTDHGVVVRLVDGTFVPETMRWGFVRAFNPAINNARADKLESGMWRNAWQAKNRCLIPVRDFFEWSGTKGHKQTHRIRARAEDDGWMWMAGLWEEDPQVGRCYSMITTAASLAMRGIHDRMPAMLRRESFDTFLDADNPVALMRPFDGPLEIADCENPLVTKRSEGQRPRQMDLFG